MLLGFLWQVVNPGDVAHTPGVPEIVRPRITQAIRQVRTLV
jgi:hypothetical protein